MEYFQSSCMSDLVLILAVFFIYQVAAFPSGAPLSACGHLMPVHVDGKQEMTASPYVLILNDTSYGSHPLKLTITTVGAGARDFMAFMLQARSEFEEPTGYFSDVPPASKTMKCYKNEDTLTHTAAFIRSGMEVIWHPPSKNIGKISITGSVAVSKVKFWAVESNALIGTGPLERPAGSGQVQQTGNNTGSGNIGSSGNSGSSGNIGSSGKNGAVEVAGTMISLISVLLFAILHLGHVCL